METTLIQQMDTKARIRKRYIDGIVSLWDSDKNKDGPFIKQANKVHSKIKFTTETSDNVITLFDTEVFKEEQFKNESILDIRIHFQPTENFQHTQLNTCHPPGVKNGFL